MDSIPWGTDSELSQEQFYDRGSDFQFLKNLLESTSKGSAPTLMITGIRGVGKTVLLKKVKNEFEKDYLVNYVDLSRAIDYKTGKITETSIIDELFNSWMKVFDKKGFNTISKKISKFFKTKNFSLKELVNIGGIPVPIPESKDNYIKMLNFILNLPQEVYNENSEDIDGVLLFIDEFQMLKFLDDNLDSFLWFLRSIVQSQKNVAYIFSGSLSLKDDLVEKIAGREGAFGGRMLNIDIAPFSKEIVKTYLSERIPELKLENSGFERFYKCTQGIPFYVNTFAKLLPKDVNLSENEIKSEFKQVLPYIAVHLSNQWNRLTFQEQKIIISLIEKPIKRKDIADTLNITTGSLSNSLNNLQNLELLYSDNGVYSLSEPILGAWLKREFEIKGVYPFRI